MTRVKAARVLVVLSLICLCAESRGGRIVYPWRATTAIAKTGDSFEVWFDASEGQIVSSAILKGSYNSLQLDSIVQQSGSWVYDPVSSNAYNTRITITVPDDAPAERYDLVLNTSAGVEVSRRAVNVVREYRTEYTIIHLSDTHMCQGAKINGHPERLFKISALAEIANIIGPEMVFVTGDLINNNMFPPEQRSAFFYDGYEERGLKGMHGFDAPTFATVGNHDFLEGELPGEGFYAEKAEFWNAYHGLQSHHFKFGDTRCMIVNNGWNGFDWSHQLAGHAGWLAEEGEGTLRLAAYHKSEMGIMGAWANQVDLGLALIGHNHHLAFDNPYELGGRRILYYADSVRDHLVFNLFRVTGDGSYVTVNNAEAVENPGDAPSAWRPRLTLNYVRPNDGTSKENTATLNNQFEVGFPRARVRFIMPKGITYTVLNGSVEQAFDGDAVHVVDVRVPIEAERTVVIEIKPDLQADIHEGSYE